MAAYRSEIETVPDPKAKREGPISPALPAVTSCSEPP